MIKTAGSNVSPAEVEEEMQSLEGVHNAYVVGLPDQDAASWWWRRRCPRGGVAGFGAIEAELRKRLSGYKVPRAYVDDPRGSAVLHSNKVVADGREADGGEAGAGVICRGFRTCHGN